MNDFVDAFFATPGVTEALSDDAAIRQICRFEIALAQAEAEAGAIPMSAAAAIADGLGRFVVPHGDARAALFAEAAKAGTLAIPLVKQLTAAVRRADAEAARYVHYGSTSQDAIDTAAMMQLAEAWALIAVDLDRLCAAAAVLAARHRETLMLGRTLLQPALPITFGLKAAQWLVAAIESRDRLRATAPQALVPQFGGAAGTLGSLKNKGIAVAERLAAHLPGLHRPRSLLPWHTRRGALAGFCSEIGILVGACGKIAQDIALLMQIEVGEAFEPAEEGRGGSSALPHKRNPVRCMQTLAAATRAPHLVATLLSALPQQHERSLGGWQAEWAVVPELFKLTSGAVANMAATLEGLRVEAAAMRHHLEALNGLPFAESFSIALAPHLGRDEAHKLVEEASQAVGKGEGPLAAVLAANPRVSAHLDRAAIEAIGDPDAALGACGSFIDEALALWTQRSVRDAIAAG